MNVYIYIYIYIYIHNGSDSSVVRALSWDMKVPGSIPGRCKLSGLQVRLFRVFGGVPSPPEHRATGSRTRRLAGSSTSKKKQMYEYVYIYIYTYEEGAAGMRERGRQSYISLIRVL